MNFLGHARLSLAGSDNFLFGNLIADGVRGSDLSGWSPKYFPKILVQYANTILKKKMLFGSDWPAITPDRWLADFENLPIRDEVRPLILKENARKLLGM